MWKHFTYLLLQLPHKQVMTGIGNGGSLEVILGKRGVKPAAPAAGLCGHLNQAGRPAGLCQTQAFLPFPDVPLVARRILGLHLTSGWEPHCADLSQERPNSLGVERISIHPRSRLAADQPSQEVKLLAGAAAW